LSIENAIIEDLRDVSNLVTGLKMRSFTLPKKADEFGSLLKRAEVITQCPLCVTSAGAD
jgi:hypothetical protein